jgi:hypothetical protein
MWMPVPGGRSFSKGAVMKRQTRRYTLGSLRTESNKLSRRQFMAQGGRVVAGSVITSVASADGKQYEVPFLFLNHQSKSLAKNSSILGQAAGKSCRFL